MKEFGLKGIVVPMVTPFKLNKDQDVDEDRLRDLVNFLIDNGVHGLIPCGGTGEAVSLSPEENKKVTEITVEEAAGRIPVIAGAKNPGTRNSVDLAKDAKKVGADGVMVIGPYYNYPITEEGYYEHFRSVAEEANVPVLVYNLPSIQGDDIPIGVIKRLADLNNILGIKNSTTDFVHIHQAIKICNEKNLSYLQGKAQNLLPSLALGGHGSITSLLNVAPAAFVDLYNSFMKGDVSKSRALNSKLLPLIELGGSPVVIKTALDILGHPVGSPRKPLMPSTSGEKKAIRKALVAAGLV